MVLFFIRIAAKLNDIIKVNGLRDIGHIEQDFVFEDAGTMELFSFMKTKEVPLTPSTLFKSFGNRKLSFYREICLCCIEDILKNTLHMYFLCMKVISTENMLGLLMIYAVRHMY